MYTCIQDLKQMMIEGYKIYYNNGPTYMGENFNKMDICIIQGV